MSEASWSNYWQGRDSDKTGALTGVESDRDLQRHWAAILSKGSRDAPFLDLACGAGTVLKQAHSLSYTDLTGLDISPEAIGVLESAIPSVKTVVASAAQTGLPDAGFATIVSQFGIEYAGVEAGLIEAARLCRDSGHIETVMHMSGGAIEAEVRGHAKHCEVLLASGFIERSAALFQAAYSGNTAKQAELSNNLIPAREQVSALVKPGERSLAVHLLQGTAQLWDRRASYTEDDITGWLDGMKVEIEAYKARMDSMISAALTDTELKRCVSMLENRGFTVETKSLSLSGADAAWVLSASKRG